MTLLDQYHVPKKCRESLTMVTNVLIPSTPNGLIATLFGPVEGQRHDRGMIRETGIHQQARECSDDLTENYMCTYDKLVDPLKPYLQISFRNISLTQCSIL